MTEATVRCKCVGCGKTRDVPLNSIPVGDVPMCESCFMPMATVGPVKATFKKAKK